ncbi:pgl [Symbiodinium sp. CCMP2592]|nr:pgl [Symbiodinium sp. CCMP2592]
MTVRGTLCLVLGGRNLGKTLLKEAAIARCKANVNMVSVDMRDADMLGKDLMTALDLQQQKSLGWARLSVEILRAVIQFPVDYALKRINGFSGAGVAAKEVLDAAVSRHQIRIDNFISRSKKVPCIIVDEANLAIPGIVAEDGRALAGSALQAITKWTKQTPRASVTMISSEFSYPFRLLANGLALSSIQQLLVIGEVPQSDMKKMLKDDWGMDEDLSKMFYDIFGGDIYTTKQALDSLIRKKNAFDPFAVLLCPGLPSCVKNAAARAHLANIDTQGFSLVEDVETDEGAKMIAEKNLGGVISRSSMTFGLPDIFNGTDKKWAVIPSTYHMKLLIHRGLQQIPLPKSGPSAGSAGSAAPAQPTVIWACQFRKDGSTIEVAGNVFQVKGAFSNVDDLKKAIKNENPKTVTCDAFQLDIYSQKDRKWVKEDEANELNRGTSKEDCYGFMLPQKTDDA